MEAIIYKTIKSKTKNIISEACVKTIAKRIFLAVQKKPKIKSKAKTKSKPEEICPICLESVDLLRLECSHYMCKQCISLIRKAECPLCRKKLTKLTVEQKKQIHKNYIKQRKEQVQEDRQDILEDSDTESDSDMDFEAFIIDSMNNIITVFWE
jgi:chromosomal replication initiation ATPase DnaA